MPKTPTKKRVTKPAARPRGHAKPSDIAPLIRVGIYEYERGWGSRLDEVRTFKQRAKADAWVRAFNAVNNKPQVPDWYMTARVLE